MDDVGDGGPDGAGTTHVEVHVTAPDAATAARLARLLVDERLAACVQVVPGVRSTYRWEGAVETAEEHLLLVKSTAALFEAVRQRVRAEHPYDTPEVLAVPVVAVDASYAGWLDASVRPAGDDAGAGPGSLTR
ncbi:divalent-cation tolerance protein CutA [Fodinibacter luteus]|uniref:divalent-cation tolerance protein CutA n=1 Tax=Fodinibacter luteus TaxID=552064 RepID=UPI0031EDF80A